MKRSFQHLLAAPLFLALLAACGSSNTQNEAATIATITVSNPLAFDRVDEIVSINLAKAMPKASITTRDSIVILDSLGNQVPYQRDFHHARSIIFPATVAAGSQTVYRLVKGAPIKAHPVVAGRQYPERVDDFAWENEYSAYRCYGPALQASGERAYGFDVWVKNTPELVVEDRYTTEHNAKPEIQRLRNEGKTDEAEALERQTSYHYDHGKGLDCYKVGATLGGGTPGLYKDGQLIYPYCYTTYEVLEDGPLRMIVRFDFEEKLLNGKPYTERRFISFEKGSRMNTCVVYYDGLQGKKKSQGYQVASGLVVHSENTDYVLNPERHYIAYADPTDPSQGGVEANGSIFVGIVAPQLTDAIFLPWGPKEDPADMKARGGADGHILALQPLPESPSSNNPSTPIIYYFGSSWSKADMPDMASWERYLDEFAQKVENPLQVTIE